MEKKKKCFLHFYLNCFRRSADSFKEAQQFLYDDPVLRGCDLPSFLQMWKFCVFLKLRFLPDNKTFGTSTEKLQHFKKIKFISACREKV